MIDFIAYVVSELKQKKLSKENALALIKQFSTHSTSETSARRLHPLLHRNTSNLYRQSYAACFSGEEFFLKDHRILGQKLLPGVAYLEMARCAVAHATGKTSHRAIMTLRDILWRRPLAVNEPKEVTVAVYADDTRQSVGEQIGYEIISQEQEEEQVHFRGRAVFDDQGGRGGLDILHLMHQMKRDRIDAPDIYPVFSAMGAVFGPSHQAITAIYPGQRQLLAVLRLPEVVEHTWGDFLLHPSLMDSALQACVGLIADPGHYPKHPVLPFALDTLRILSPFTKEMIAWIRHAADSRPGDRIIKTDIDLCDADGHICVQMKGVSSRATDASVTFSPEAPVWTGLLLAAPQWRVQAVTPAVIPKGPVFDRWHVFVCGLPRVKIDRLTDLAPDSWCEAMEPLGQTADRRYTEASVTLFDKVRELLQGKRPDGQRIQIAIADEPESQLFAGLSGLLKTAARENPRVSGQIIVTSPTISTEDLAGQLIENRNRPQDTMIRYDADGRKVLRWRLVKNSLNAARIPFKDYGVYLITGGLGGLGRVFAKEILRQTAKARVVLTGRFALNARKKALMDAIAEHGGRLSYRQLDLEDPARVGAALARILKTHKRIDGIVHSAGMLDDTFILNKNPEAFRRVLAPKVTGLCNLDSASKDIALDFMVLFSSVAGVMGNPGQADYATANSFMDQFAAYRNTLAAEGKRRGRTLSLNWPLWRDGGMRIEPAALAMLQNTAGMRPMPTAAGIDAFYQCLACSHSQMLVLEGEDSALGRALLLDPAAAPQLLPRSDRRPPPAAKESISEALMEQTSDYLRRQLSTALDLPVHKIDPLAPLEKYGIDSILAMDVTNALERDFGALPKTLFFEYQTIHALAKYFTTAYPDLAADLFTGSNNNRPFLAETVKPVQETATGLQNRPAPAKRLINAARYRAAHDRSGARLEAEPIAIIGLSGRYPAAVDIQAYWRNLRDGKDCIIQVPEERWNWREYYTEDRGKPGCHYSKWGGFIDGVDEFDPLFFNISPLEAELMDPQERLFLQHAWMAVEDAGYTRAGLQIPHGRDLSGQVGVYAGVMYSEYQLLGVQAGIQGNRMGFASNTAGIANRVSYQLNLHGPSMTLDTLCSSSLAAIYLACQDLRLGRTDMALAGGVNVSIHPNKYLMISAGQFIAADGRCQSFGEGGDGYIPAEGVGVVVLKRLTEAEQDGDHIYGLIAGGALNHGGKANGYTVPNLAAQAAVIRRALTDAGVHPRHISYIEAHGTGTKLGDPIEIGALTRVFQEYTHDRGFCLIGSAKSNIGHCESAAGIAGLTKVLLQMRHGRVAPSLHSQPLNPHIDFSATPFVVNQTLKNWDPPVIDGQSMARIAGVSSFGAAGSNAHLIVQEYRPPERVKQTMTTGFRNEQVIVPLSAGTTAQLQQKVSDLLAFITEQEKTAPLDLFAMAYTLQVGREAMEERLGFLVGSVAQLADRLKACANGGQNIENVWTGRAASHQAALSMFSTDSDLRETVEKWMAEKRFSKILDLWVKGLDLDWSKLYGPSKPRRVSLPVYPFARRRYWVDVAGDGLSSPSQLPSGAPHRLLHANTSDFSGQSYATTLTGEEFFLSSHLVRINGGSGRKILPAVVYLEMARAAVAHASGHASAVILELCRTAWPQPLAVDQPKRITIALFANDDGTIDYQIGASDNGREERVHCRGQALLKPATPPARLDIDRLQEQMRQGGQDPDRVYSACDSMGIHYGPGLKGLAALYRGENQLLARLRLPEAVKEGCDVYTLHPSVMDSALQACLALVGDLNSQRLAGPVLPFALDRLRIISGCEKEMAAWVRYADGCGPGDRFVKVDIDLCDHEGNICVQLQGLCSRESGANAVAVGETEPRAETLLAEPVWTACGDEASGVRHEVADTRRHILLCDMAWLDISRLKALVPCGRCLKTPESSQGIAQKYHQAALTGLELVRSVLSGVQGPALVQIVAVGHQEQTLYAGLSGLLKTAALENPQFIGQLILTRAGISAEELAEQLIQSRKRLEDPIVWHTPKGRRVLRWQAAAQRPDNPRIAWNDRGVYLITGGLGALGRVFAKEILRRTAKAFVVLTGRSPLTAEKQAAMDGVAAGDNRLAYRPLDLADLEATKALLASILKEYGRLDGILHSAGMIDDAFIIGKTPEAFSRVLAPKVFGAYHLDLASRDIPLDFMAFFSSIAGAKGNAGQADYAAANSFMDQFAAYRNGLTALGRRSGKTVSINWPLWRRGGMRIDPAGLEIMRAATGMRPMGAATGIGAFYYSLQFSQNCLLVMEGDAAKAMAFLEKRSAMNPARALTGAPRQPLDDQNGKAVLLEAARNYLRNLFSGVLKLPVSDIDPKAPLEKYGIDSILAMTLTTELEKRFGSLSKTLFFEYQTLQGLAGYFAQAFPEKISETLAADVHKTTIDALAPHAPATGRFEAPPPALRSRNRYRPPHMAVSQPIAIVGLGGRYPMADDLAQFWANLESGRDCITQIPAERWRHERYFHPDRDQAGKSYSKWGGFIEHVDQFDPLFFNISPKEAERIDPQERLFIETVWQTIEDAGYSKESIGAGRVGVYVGVMWGHYELFGAESILRGGTDVTGSSYASIANRVSYFFNFRGPSMAIDTMCSSSLTAIHLACDAIRNGDIDAAVAGGVNVSAHPYKYLSLSQGNFASSDGKCRSFGRGGDGYVPGEGVGAILLKPLERALQDGDHIYAVIKSSAINHGGKTNGYTVPNPNAQGELIGGALKKAAIDPATLSYIEAHGTGTALGDPIEITGLIKAFEAHTRQKRFCPIGSVKSNIGHLESAAGIAAVTKVLLQLKHNQLAPSLHADDLNPNIRFEQTPFYVQTKLSDWPRRAEHPRRAGVSSFGAGGANAHLILEEYEDTEKTVVEENAQVFVLSAKNQDCLLRYALRMIDFIKHNPDVSLRRMAYTSQVGRTPMNQRLAIVATSAADLGDKLDQWAHCQKNEVSSAGHGLEGIYHGAIRKTQANPGALIEGDAGKAFVRVVLEQRDLEKMATLWVAGIALDWSVLHGPRRPKRLSLPTYPFSRERCWIEPPRIGAESKSADEKEPRVDAEEKNTTLYYRPQWQARLLSLAKAWRPKGAIMILNAAPVLAGAIGRELETVPDAVVIEVTAAGEFSKLSSGAFAIDPEQQAHYDRLIESLSASGRLPRYIVHACPPGSEDEADGPVSNRNKTAGHLSRGFYALFYLCRALMKKKQTADVRILSVHASRSDAPEPLNAALGGFFKTLAQENPNYQGKTAQFVNDRNDTRPRVTEMAEQIVGELRAAHWKTQAVCYRFTDKGHERFVKTLTPYRPDQTPMPDSPIRQNGVYLVTGGLGGVGYVFCRYLSETVNARLILLGRSAPDVKQEKKMDALGKKDNRAVYIQADVRRPDQVSAAVAQAKALFGGINGVLHCAGVNKDNYLLRKNREEIDAVLGPKVHGAVHLDAATRSEPLDLFVLFSSVAGAMGNAGQCDYAYANHFLDAFAEKREQLRKVRQRSGKTLSINWPYWEAGGMVVSDSAIRIAAGRTGIRPLPATEGVACLKRLLCSDLTQGVVLYGAPSKIKRYVAQADKEMERDTALLPETMDDGVLREKLKSYLKQMIGAEIGLAPERIDDQERFELFGMDSVMIGRFNLQLEKDLGPLSKTVMYEYDTVKALAEHLMQNCRTALWRCFAAESTTPDGGESGDTARAAVAPVREALLPPRAGQEAAVCGKVAIIGVHARFPGSPDLSTYWDNLKQGRDLITLVPPERWNYETFYDPDPEKAAQGKIYCKWGGFVDDCDKFDPSFFNISSKEASSMDPQERLFLESVWAAIEDAGYAPQDLKRLHPKAKSADVGVFVGVTTHSYHLLGTQQWRNGAAAPPAALSWSIANRVSYFFDFQGPSMPVDTACSSSLVAIHQACDSLNKGACRLAIAGGVNLYLHPSKYNSFCRRRAVSLGGKCRSYGAGDDGFVPGEGVGAFVLKPLDKAIEHQDHIYAVICASAFDHSGRSNGYSAPNPNSQADLISRTLDKAAVDAETIGYIEGHGTGTQLGDSLEVAALTQAFRKHTDKKRFCSLASVKANIGHGESVAGMAGVARILMQFRHQQLAPALYADKCNPDIDFAQSPFYLQPTLERWEKPSSGPRRALINSFGAGGVNACAILEEYEQTTRLTRNQNPGPHLVVLSAKNEARLRDYAKKLRRFVMHNRGVNLADMSYTLRVGREAMRARLAMVIEDHAQLMDHLSAWIDDKPLRGTYGSAVTVQASGDTITDGAPDPGKRTTDAAADLRRMAQKWAAGETVAWEKRPPKTAPLRVPLPTYPFARQRYWVADTRGEDLKTGAMSGALHPLLTHNASTLETVRFCSLLSHDAFYAMDHKVAGQQLLPGACFLEMACIAGTLAGEKKVSKITDIVWTRPLRFDQAPLTVETCMRSSKDGAEYAIASYNDDNERIVHSEGRLFFHGRPDGSDNGGNASISQLKEQCATTWTGAHCYDLFESFGFSYGASFKTIQEFYVNGSYALSKLKIAKHLEEAFDQFILHPSIVDGALQTVVGLMGGDMPASGRAPFAIDEIEIHRPLSRQCYAHAQYAEPDARMSRPVFNLTLFNEQGDTLIAIKNLYFRSFHNPNVATAGGLQRQGAGGAAVVS